MSRPLVAGLPMYNRAPLVPAHQEYWDSIRAALDDQGVRAPLRLDQSIVGVDHWLNPALVFSQTCGMPYRLHLHGKVNLIGTPDFGLPDCAPGYYCSRYVVRADDKRTALTDYAGAVLAYNNSLSQSGYAAPLVQAGQIGIRYAAHVESGAHLNSAMMVRDHQADIAAIDAVTWRLIEQWDPWVDDLRVLDSSPATPGLPYICSLVFDSEVVRGAVRNAIVNLTDPTRRLLGIRSLVSIDAANYLAVASPSAPQR